LTVIVDGDGSTTRGNVVDEFSILPAYALTVVPTASETCEAYYFTAIIDAIGDALECTCVKFGDLCLQVAYYPSPPTKCPILLFTIIALIADHFAVVVETVRDTRPGRADVSHGVV